MKNWYELNFKGQFLHDNLLNYNKEYKIWYTERFDIKDVVSDKGIDFLRSMKFIPVYANLFSGPPHSKTSIHIDNFQKSYAINFVWNVTDSSMTWYHVDNLYSRVGKEALTTANSKYISFDTAHDIEEVEKVNLSNKLCLVRTNIPHSAENYENKMRYCLSIRGIPVINIWENTVKHFNNYIIH